YTEPTSPNSFIFFEEWANQDAIDAHFATPHFKAFMEQFPPMIDGAPNIAIYATKVVEGPAPKGTPDLMLISGRFAAKPERRADLIALATGMFAPSRAEPGCISYDFFEEAGSENRFLFFERWRDAASIDAHFATSHFNEFMKAFPPLIEGDADIRRYAVSATKTL
ncbi:MAG: putative quinol monooxygenase, partial [Polyangiaceae bacterium]